MQEEEVNSDLEYLVLATDGLWDVVRNEVSFLISQLEKPDYQRQTVVAYVTEEKASHYYPI